MPKKTIDNTDICRRFAYIREEKKLTRTSFADVLGINQSVVGDIELGYREPSKAVLLKLASVYGVNIHWMLTGEGEMFLDNAQKPEQDPFIEILNQKIREVIEPRLAEIESRITEITARRDETPPRKPPKYPPEPPISLQTTEPAPAYPELPEQETDADENGIDEEDESEPWVRILYVDNIAAGPLIFQNEDPADYIKIHPRLIRGAPQDYYVANIEGQSMTEAGIPDGCKALIRRNDIPENQAIQVVAREGRSTLKLLRELEDGGWEMHYEDGTNRSIALDSEDFRIQGDFVMVLNSEDYLLW